MQVPLKAKLCSHVGMFYKQQDLYENHPASCFLIGHKMLLENEMQMSVLWKSKVSLHPGSVFLMTRQGFNYSQAVTSTLLKWRNTFFQFSLFNTMHARN